MTARSHFGSTRPKPLEVLVTGDWMTRTDKPIPLSKREDGVWVGTAGPLEPNVYFYGFNVDGIKCRAFAKSLIFLNSQRLALEILGLRMPAAPYVLRGLVRALLQRYWAQVRSFARSESVGD